MGHMAGGVARGAEGSFFAWLDDGTGGEGVMGW